MGVYGGRDILNFEFRGDIDKGKMGACRGKSVYEYEVETGMHEIVRWEMLKGDISKYKWVR